jgi:hypothetical protein
MMTVHYKNKSAMDANHETKDVTVVDEKKQAKLSQLAGARESAKQKKLKRELDFDVMSSKLDKLAAALEEKTSKAEDEIEADDTPEPPRKRIRVTKQEEEEAEGDEQDDVDSSSGTDSMAVTALRTGAVLGLAGVSWYFQNVWKKAAPKAATGHPPKRRRALPDTPTETPTTQNLLPRKVPIQVGRSGFHL